jgi:hypothetical protein
MLFPEISRTRIESLRRGERQFDFYNACARPGYDDFRALVNGWLSQMPEADRAELVARMSRGGDRAFQAGLVELVVHALLKKLNDKIVIHPTVPGTNKRPDFSLETAEGQTLCYVEVTTINPPALDDAEANRETPIYNAIDHINLPPGCILRYELIHAGTDSPPLGESIQSVKSWVDESCKQAKESPVAKRFSTTGWEIELELFAVESNKSYEHAIGIAQGGVGWIAPHIDLREALKRKASRYGVMDAPYLIVVADSKGQIVGSDSIQTTLTEAVLGDEVVQWRQGESTGKLTHANNGFWRGRDAARNAHVSAAMLFPDPGLWPLRSEKHQPTLAINPWASHPLPDLLRIFRRFEAENERWTFKDGQLVADVIGLPTPWPPEVG